MADLPARAGVTALAAVLQIVVRYRHAVARAAIIDLAVAFVVATVVTDFAVG
jgi:hypothetical protein